MMPDQKFVVCLNCIDGRTQLPVINFLKQKYNCDYVDMITEPGIVKVVSDEKSNATFDTIKEKLKISIDKHQAKAIAVASHYDCAANGAEEKIHREQIQKAAQRLSKQFNLPTIGLWLNDKFAVEEIVTTP